MDGAVLLNQVKFWCINRILGCDLIPEEREQEKKRKVRKREHLDY